MIHPETTLGAVHLTVRDFERSLGFYQHQLGFQLHQKTGNTARLGAGGSDLLVLYENKTARLHPRTTGLYHFAVLVPSRLELAYSLTRITETKTQIQGFADHLVSEAIYLADPDGNGIEIYRDRPRQTWQMVDGQIKMAADPLDIESILEELNGHDQTWPGLDPETKIGHIHLHVANINKAENFYNNILGFDMILRYGPSASFLSAGGYHHHIGINTWNGAGAPPPPPDAVGLRYFVVELPDQDELEQILTQVRNAAIAIHEQDNGWLVHDPAANGLLLTMPEPAV